MEEFIFNQIVKARDIVIKDLNGNRIKDFINESEVIIEKYVDERETLISDILYEIEFESQVVKPKDSRIRPIPLLTMRGNMLDQINDLVYLKTYGINRRFNKCQHCLRFGNYESLCDKCEEEIGNPELINWEGWIPLTSIKKVIKVEE